MKCKIYSLFRDNILSADLANMQLISKYNKCVRFLLFVIDIYSKYTWVAPKKCKKYITITDALQNFLDESTRKPNKIWVDQISECYSRSWNSGLHGSIKCNQYAMNVVTVVVTNPLLLRDLLEP